MARKPQYKIFPTLVPDWSSGFTPTTDDELTLAEAVVLSIPPGSNLTVDALLGQFPNLYVQGQQNANFRSTNPTNI